MHIKGIPAKHMTSINKVQSIEERRVNIMQDATTQSLTRCWAEQSVAD